MDWYPFLRPIFRRLPSRISGIRDKIAYLKELEENLWRGLLENAKRSMKEGKMNESKTPSIFPPRKAIPRTLRVAAEINQASVGICY
jgi:hypothetical protein